MNVAAILKTKGRTVVTARPSATVLEIAGQLSTKKIGAIVIIGDGGKVAGIFTERDLVYAISKYGVDVLNQSVSTVMTSKVVVCELTTTVDEMMDLMTTRRFRHIPVVEDDSLVGLVSIGDVVKHHIAEVEMEVSAMRFYLNG